MKLEWFFLIFWEYLLLINSASSLFGMRTDTAAYITSTCDFSTGGPIALKDNFEWIKSIDDEGLYGTCTLIGFQGDFSDCEALFDEVVAFNNLHKYNFGGRCLPTTSIANLCRSIIARNLRTRKDLLDVQLVIAGRDPLSRKPVLFWLDNIGSLRNVPYAAHGNQFSSILSFFDHHYKSTVDDDADIKTSISTRGEALAAVRNLKSGSETDLLFMCWLNLKKRSAGKIGKVSTKCITLEGKIEDFGQMQI